MFAIEWTEIRESRYRHMQIQPMASGETEPKSDPAGAPGPLKVGVLVDLDFDPDGGGHVKVWEHYARAAAAFPDEVDLTIHFQGPAWREIVIAPNVRLRTHPPAFSTSRIPLLGLLPTHMDLAPVHRELLGEISDCDVVHTTDGYFAYTRTATIAARRKRIGLVSSIHTDTPGHTRLFTGLIIRKQLGNGWFGNLVVDKLRVPERLGDMMQRRLYRYLARCDRVLLPERRDLFPELRDYAQASPMPRGIDKTQFHPDRGDRARLVAEYGIPDDRCIVVFAGRIDDSKDIMTLARAGRSLIERGAAVHFIVAGEGNYMDQVKAELGDRVVMPGWLNQDELAWLFASADLFAFPSRLDVVPNVVLEAMACGLTPMVAAESAVYVRDNDTGFIVREPTPAAWTEALESACGDPERLARMGQAVRRFIETERRSWQEVVGEILLPTWRAAAAAAGRR